MDVLAVLEARLEAELAAGDGATNEASGPR
jgi:hypothetical protein